MLPLFYFVFNLGQFHLSRDGSHHFCHLCLASVQCKRHCGSAAKNLGSRHALCNIALPRGPSDRFSGNVKLLTEQMVNLAVLVFFAVREKPEERKSPLPPAGARVNISTQSGDINIQQTTSATPPSRKYALMKLNSIFTGKTLLLPLIFSAFHKVSIVFN